MKIRLSYVFISLGIIIALLGTMIQKSDVQTIGICTAAIACIARLFTFLDEV